MEPETLPFPQPNGIASLFTVHTATLLLSTFKSFDTLLQAFAIRLCDMGVLLESFKVLKDS